MIDSRLTIRCSAGLSLLLIAASLTAQSGLVRSAPSAHTGAARVVPIHTAADDEGHAYGIWAAGARYKVSFHGGGACFVPYLGKHYPHNQPWSWKTESVRIGGTELVTAPSSLSYGATRAEYALGDVIEAWDVRAEGTEQTFVIPRRVGTGDLVVQGVVQSMLQCKPVAPAHRALSFVDGAGDELVRYGAATAIDALGNRRPMTTSFDGGKVTLRLDAAWLENARFPLVVDPIVGPGTSVAGTGFEVDVVRSPNLVGSSPMANWVAWSQFASSNDADILMYRWEDDGTAGPQTFADLSTSWSARNPSVTYSTGAAHLVMAFERRFLQSNTRRIRVHRQVSSTFTLLTNVDFLPGTSNDWRADVGGTRFVAAGNEVMIVFQRENAGAFSNTSSSSVFGATYDASAGTFGTPFAIASQTFFDYERPSINQVSWSPNNVQWAIAFQQRSPLIGTGAWRVTSRLLGPAGTIGSALGVDSGYSDHLFAPKIEGSLGRYLVACMGTPLQAGPAPTEKVGRELRTTRIDWTQTGGTEPHGSVSLVTVNTDEIEMGDVGFDGKSRSHWPVMYRNASNGDLGLFLCGYQGIATRFETAYSGSIFTNLGGVTFNPITNDFTIAYIVNELFAARTETVRFVYPAVGPATTSGVGCSPAQISWEGSQQIGSELSRIRVFGSNNDSIHTVAVALGPINAPINNVRPIQNGCSLLVPASGPDFLGLLDVRIGSNHTWQLSLPENLPTDDYFVQGWHTVGNGNLDFVSTQRLTVPTVK